MLFNRDLSWLAFNHLVLQQAAKKDLPVYEKLKFLSIFSSNLDEFFRVRYPIIIALAGLGKKTLKKASIKAQEDIQEKIQDTVNEHLADFGDILLNTVIPELKKNKIFFYYNSRIKPEHLPEIKDIFTSKVLSFIQPVVLGTTDSHNFSPENNMLYFIATVKEKTSSISRRVIINIPVKKLDRFFVLTPINGMNYVIFLDDIIRCNIELIFPSSDVESVYSIKFNRDAGLKLNNEYSSDILEKLEKKLKKRDKGQTSRFLYERNMPTNLRLFLATVFNISLEGMFEGGYYHNLSDLKDFPKFDASLEMPEFKHLNYPGNSGDIFSLIIKRDILLHLPYHSYSPLLSFFNQAAIDESVTEIYITLYRVASESHIVNALISAAKNGKKVFCYIELKARFDEANNIKWSREMKKAGIHLTYSQPNIKIHSKIALVRKRVGDSYIDLTVLSTGNFNEITATFYTDHVLLSAEKELAKEIKLLFDFLSGKISSSQKSFMKLNELIVSRFNMLSEFKKLINLEIKKVAKNKKGLIRIKVNNIEDPEIIKLLYEASSKGVEIRLIVRSVCCIIPGMENLSERIEVRRIVDRFLEHTRLFIFGSDDKTTVFMGSSDLMMRNIRHRIEVCVKIKEDKNKNLLTEYFEMQWKDNTNAVKISKDLENIIPERIGDEFNAQKEIYKYLANKSD